MRDEKCISEGKGPLNYLSKTSLDQRNVRVAECNRRLPSVVDYEMYRRGIIAGSSAQTLQFPDGGMSARERAKAGRSAAFARCSSIFNTAFQLCRRRHLPQPRYETIH